MSNCTDSPGLQAKTDGKKKKLRSSPHGSWRLELERLEKLEKLERLERLEKQGAGAGDGRAHQRNGNTMTSKSKSNVCRSL